MRVARLRRIATALGQVPFDARTHFVGLLALIGYCAYEVASSASHCDVWEWDAPAISALALVLIWIRVATAIDGSLNHALRRLHARGVIVCSEDELGYLHETLALRRRKLAPVWGLGIGAAIVAAFAVSWEWGVACRPAPFEPSRIALLAILAPSFYASGYYIGWTVIQGQLARVLRARNIEYLVQPGHPDGAGGLRPLGDFFFRQAMLAGLPAVYVAVWLTFFKQSLIGIAATTRTVFLALLPVFVFIEAAAFLCPMWAFHRVMLRQKRSYSAQADEIARRISTTQAQLRGSTDPIRLEELNTRLTLDLKLHAEMESLPTWPVSKQVRRRFALQNLILVAIPLLRFLDAEVVDAVKRFFGG